MKKILLLIIVFFLSFSTVKAEDLVVLPSQIGVVQSVEYIDNTDTSKIEQTRQEVEVKLIKGEHKNKLIKVDNILTGNPNYDINLKQGTKVILHVEKDNDNLIFSIEGIYRSSILIWLSLIFCSLLIYIGRKKGLYSLISIAITALLITNCLSPMILAGVNPVLASLLICLLSTAITIYLVGGFNRKSTSAILGCILSIVVAMFLSVMTVKMAALTGFSDEYSMFLFAAHPHLDFIGIIISSMLLATLGAVMDVAMSIASTINEIYSVDNAKTVKELFKCGMNVGRDIIGTMANTLILVYLGGSLPLILLTSNIDLQKFFNLNHIVTEISAAIIGSCAIVICVPITAIVASELIKNMPAKIDFSSLEE